MKIVNIKLGEYINDKDEKIICREHWTKKTGEFSENILPTFNTIYRRIMVRIISYRTTILNLAISSKLLAVKSVHC